ncbi:glycosyltransferase [uncultured Brachyspira sp.]|uniref:glycosyltransferase n=1 Tax=uncultured Brachyspira sp. TaxID=221953 RepID=UPI0026061F52|nr:glycosyltransferase [uncultured Brachyspira sp.]
MCFNIINNIVWYIPFKKLRNSLRDFLNSRIENEKSLMDSINNLERKIECNNRYLFLLDIRSKARMSLLSMGDNKIIHEFRKEKLIVSLTSYPERIYDIDIVIYSIINQSIKPDKIILWLSYDEFPNCENDVPTNILNLKKFGLEIKFCKNIYSYKKLIYALKEFPNDIIVTADDDIYYPYNWLEKLYNSYLDNPNYIHCHRAFLIKKTKSTILPITQWEFIRNVNNSYKASYLNYFTTGAGVLFKKKYLHEDVFNEELFKKLAPTDDDKWFFLMSVLNNTKINVVNNNICDIIDIGYDNYHRLYDINRTGVNYQTFLNILEYYGNSLKEKFFGGNFYE